MAKQPGLGDNLYVGGYDLSGDTGSIGNVGGGPAAGEITGIDKSAVERIGLLRDGRLEWSAWFNPSGAHPPLAALPTADVIATYCRGTTLGDPACCVNGKQINYDPARSNDGSLTVAVQVQANGYGAEWGRLLTAGKRTDTAATNGTGVDHTTVSTAFGWQAYLQVFTVAGTSVTVTLQDSADNSSWANLTGGAFTAVASPGPGYQRLEGGRTATVRRHLRAITSGTFTTTTFAVMFVRNDTAVSF